MRSLAFKETALGLRSGSLASTAKPRHDPVPREVACQGQSKDSFVPSFVQKQRQLSISRCPGRGTRRRCYASTRPPGKLPVTGMIDGGPEITRWAKYLPTMLAEQLSTLWLLLLLCFRSR